MTLPASAKSRATATFEGSEITIRIEQVPPVAAPDELVPFPFGLEASAARQLERDGHLKTAKIGRRKYARRSDILALIDKLAAPPARNPATSPEDAYANLVALAKRKGR